MNLTDEQFISPSNCVYTDGRMLRSNRSCFLAQTYSMFGTAVGSSVAYGSVGQGREWNKRIWDLIELLQAEINSQNGFHTFKAAWNTQLDTNNLRLVLSLFCNRIKFNSNPPQTSYAMFHI